MRRSGQVLLALLFAQILLGILTLLDVVPLALAHQGLAFVVFAAGG